MIGNMFAFYARDHLSTQLLMHCGGVSEDTN